MKYIVFTCLFIAASTVLWTGYALGQIHILDVQSTVIISAVVWIVGILLMLNGEREAIPSPVEYPEPFTTPIETRVSDKATLVRCLNQREMAWYIDCISSPITPSQTHDTGKHIQKCDRCRKLFDRMQSSVIKMDKTKARV